MSQKAKQWLGRQVSPFSISSSEGGIVGSLIGLGHIKKKIKQTKTGPMETGKYEKTREGEEWTKNQGRNR